MRVADSQTNRYGLAANTAIVFSANLAQMLIGFAITALIAATFGSAPAVDAFFIALPAPILIGQFVLSLTLLALAPYYQKLQLAAGIAVAQRRLAPLFWASMAVSLGLALFFALGADWLAAILAPGFDAVRLELLSANLRWAALALPFLAGTNFLQTIANANNSFVRPAFSRPLMTALAFAALALFLDSGSLVSYFWGLSLGAGIGFLWQLREVRSFGPWPLTFVGLIDVWRDVRRRLGWLALARGLGQSSELALQMIASLGVAGSVAIYGFGFKIAAIPLMLSVSLGVALFPRQSAASVESDSDRELSELKQGVNALTIVGAIFGSFFFIWSEQLVMTLFERGDFGAELTTTVALTVRIFSVSLVAIAVNNAVANAYWAAGRLKERIALEAVAIITLLSVALALVREYGAPALALAYGIQFVLLTGLGLWRFLGSRALGLLGAPLLVSGVAALIAFGLSFLTPGSAAFRSFSLGERLIWLAGGGLVQTALTALALYLVGVREVRALFEKIYSRIRSPKSVSSSARRKPTAVE